MNKYELTPMYIRDAQRVFEIRNVLSNLLNDSHEIPTTFIEEYNNLMKNEKVKKVVEEETEKMRKAFEDRINYLEGLDKKEDDK